MSFFSPSRTLQQARKAEPVFKTPMSFSPRRVGDKARPSPSRVELWKEELGLEDDADSEGVSNSDDEREFAQHIHELATCSLVEHEALKKELAERSAQRDELLYQIKTLRDKYKKYISRMEREEQTKKQQLKILHRTHEVHLEEKTRLINNLEAIVNEQEAHVFTLEAKLKGETVEDAYKDQSPVSKLVSHIESLQAEKVELMHKCSEEVERLRVTTVGEKENYQERMERLELENNRLQEEVIKLRNLKTEVKEEINNEVDMTWKSTGSTDAEKQACRLEVENNRIQRDLKDTRQQLARLQSQTDSQSNSDNRIIKKLKEDNVVLSQRIQDLETELNVNHQTEGKLKQRINELDDEHVKASREVRNLGVQLTALQAKSPEVVTKVQRVEIESHQTQELLDLTRKENEQLQEQIEALHEQLARDAAAYKTQQEQLQQDKADVLQEKAKIQEDNAGLLRDGENLKSDHSNLLSDHTKLQNDHANRESDYRKLQSDNDRLAKEKTSLQAELLASQLLATASSEEASAKFQAEIERLRKQLSDSTTSLESQCASKESHLEEMRGEKAVLEEQVVDLKATCKEMESHLESSERKSQELMNQMTTQEEEATIVQDQLHTELTRFQEELEQLRVSKEAALQKVRRESAERQRHLETRLDGVETQLRMLRPAMAALVAEYRTLRDACRAFPAFIQREADATTKKVVKSIADIAKYNEELIRKYRKEIALRKKYHNELVELKGNIRVFARLRPRIKEDGGGPQAEVVCDVDADDDGVVNVSFKGRTQTFEVDKAFLPAVSQSQVFSEVQALITSCIDGYNVCIFAYGQTGSGKTFTMEGTSKDPGINQRALQQLFLETAERQGEWQYTMSVSVLEIYNEMIRDLLSNDTNQKLEVKMAPEGGVRVPGLTSYEVNSVDDVNQVFAVGKKNRQTASTNMNEHSSRSHALLCVTVLGTNLTTGACAVGKLNLVDLAGSERVSKSGADGDRLKEAQSINKSLSCLGDVIHALRSRQSHIPYRNSRLTYLLQDSLGGDSKTLMIVQVSPVEKNVNETNASLSFAQRVRSVELGMATRKIENGDGTSNGDTPNGLNDRGVSRLPQQGSSSKLPTTRRK